MISRRLYALLLVSLLGAIASQIYLPTPATDTPADAAIDFTSDTDEAAQPLGNSARQSTVSGKDLFASQLPPPPSAPVVIVPPPPPEPPRAPPVPFQYLGLMEEDGVVSIYLKQGEDSLVTRVGEKIEDVYLVKRLDRQGVHLTYLPLNEDQLIPVSR